MRVIPKQTGKWLAWEKFKEVKRLGVRNKNLGTILMKSGNTVS
jgi:hypothetical protein